MNKMASAYYNHRTGSYDYLTETPADWSDYIPQVPAAQGLYQLHLQMGKTPVEAAIEVLRAVLGETREDGNERSSVSD